MPTSFLRSAFSRRSAHTAFTLLASLALLALTGCETDQRTLRPDGPPPPSAAKAPAPTPELEARAKFFDGQLETEVLLSRSGFSPRPGKGGGPGAENRGRSGFSGGFGGAAGGKRGGGGGGDRSGGGPRGDSPAGRGSSARDDDSRPRIVAENQPPVQFHLRLTNHSPAALEVEVLDFNSALGNFVVQPRKLPVAPDASVEAEPMTSRLGLTSTEFPLTLRLRAAGRTEQQILTLRPIATPTAPPSPPPPSSPPIP